MCPLCRAKTFQNQVRSIVYTINSNNDIKKDIAEQFNNLEEDQ